MQQDSSRGSSAFDEWEAGGASGEEEEEEEDWKAGRGRGGSSREEMMAKMEKKMSNEKPRPEDEPHPLRTQDWKLEASTAAHCRKTLETYTPDNS